MTSFQRAVKFAAMALAIVLTVSIISGLIGIVALFAGLSNSDTVADNTKFYAVSKEINSIAIEIGAANLTVQKGDALSVESNLKKLDVSEKNGILKIREKRLFGFSRSNAVLTVTVPEDIFIENLSIETGAGSITLEELNITREASIESGIAKISVNGGTYNNLNVDSGIGGLVFNGRVTGECEINSGIGESDITVLGKKSDYSIDVEKGIGNITVDGEKISELKTNDGKVGSIEINGGIGTINLNFK